MENFTATTKDLDEVDKRKRKKSTTAQYVKQLLHDSLITGVPQIADTKNVIRKLLKTLVLVVCIVGFIYQTTEFMKIFYSYPTVLDIDVEYPTVIDSPAITFCNLNGIRRSALCAKYPEQCRQPSDRSKFCSAFPDICEKDEKLMFPYDEAFRLEEDIDSSELQELGHNREKTLKFCFQPINGSGLVKCSREDEIHTTIPDGNTGRRNCYTLFSNVNSSELGQYKIPVPKRKDALFHMIFDMESIEYFRPDRKVGVMLGIHSASNVINPFFNGFVIQPGRLYTIHLKVVEEKLLPSPYDTQCKDYKAEWRRRGNRGPLSQETCVSECILNVSMKLCGCVIPGVLYPHKESACSEDNLDCFQFNIASCYEDCPQPCDFTDFEYDVQERELEDPLVTDLDDIVKNRGVKHDQAIVLIYLKRPEIIVYSHRPQYEDIEVFSFVGGYVGMWLGITLVAVYDFFESIILIMIFWVRRR